MNLDKLRTWLQSKKIDVAFMTDPLSISYFTGFEMKPYGRIFALVVFQDAEPFIFTPALNVEEAKNSSWNGDVKGYLDEQNPWQVIAQNIRKRIKRPQRWALEQNNLSVAHYKKLHEQFPDADLNHNLSPIIAHFRLYKTSAEIKELQAAGKEADYALKIGFQAIRTGISERSIAGQIDYQLKEQKGVMEESFSTIVQAGANAADPHLGPTMKKIQPHELVLFDLGTMHAGYASDASRTVAYGTPTAKQKEIYQIDLEAQEAAMQAAKPGMTSGELDNVARKIITKAGYGKYFIHRLGHGIGKYVHEFPDIVNGSKQILKPGMCFSIEPGIYIPGVAGVRIEDCGVLTENGFRPFTHTDKHLRVLPLKN